MSQLGSNFYSHEELNEFFQKHGIRYSHAVDRNRPLLVVFENRLKQGLYHHAVQKAA